MGLFLFFVNFFLKKTEKMPGRKLICAAREKIGGSEFLQGPTS